MYQEQACDHLPAIRSGRSSTNPSSLYLTTLPLENWPPVTTTESPSGMEQDNLKVEIYNCKDRNVYIRLEPDRILKDKPISDSSIISSKFGSFGTIVSTHDVNAIQSFPACVGGASVLKA